MIKNLIDKDFQQETNNDITLIDFYADWCGPCKMLSSVIEEISEENKDINIYKVNTDENTECTKKYEVNALPTMLILKNKEIISKIIGLTNKNSIQIEIDKAKD